MSQNIDISWRTRTSRRWLSISISPRISWTRSSFQRILSDDFQVIVGFHQTLSAKWVQARQYSRLPGLNGLIKWQITGSALNFIQVFELHTARKSKIVSENSILLFFTKFNFLDNFRVYHIVFQDVFKNLFSLCFDFDHGCTQFSLCLQICHIFKALRNSTLFQYRVQNTSNQISITKK